MPRSAACAYAPTREPPLTVTSDLELAAIVGAEHVDHDVDHYLEDITEHPRGDADVVVRPRTTAEVRDVLKLAHERGLAVTPVVAGYNVAGIAIPRRGGIVVDLTRMDGIVELDHDAMYVVVEPGVTFAQLKAFLDAEAPELVYTYPFAPPFTSVMANALPNTDETTSCPLPVGWSMMMKRPL